MDDWIIANLDGVIGYASTWGYLLVFVLMAVESSFIPFPSEVVMIPAGFLAYRGELSFHIPWFDAVMCVLFGLGGAMAGAYVNYYLAVRLGRPFLYRYGKYVMLSEKTLARAEDIFNRYGEVTTFVCRLLPGIRQLISIPAGLSRMKLGAFSLFTALGAGIWCVILLGVGWWLGHVSGEIGYGELVKKGKEFIGAHTGWLLASLAFLVAVYLLVQHIVMKSRERRA